jgi:hypothetical protein
VAEWLRVLVLDDLTVAVDVSLPPELSTLYRQLQVQVNDRYSDARQRARLNHAAHLSLSGRGAMGAAAAERQAWAQELHAASDEWNSYLPEAIETRVRRAAEIAVLSKACALAQEHGVAAVLRYRALLQQTGHAAADAQWHTELQAAAARLRGERPERANVGDPQQLRRHLEDLVWSEG